MTPADREVVEFAVRSVLWNASNYPKAVQSRILGQDITGLSAAVTDVLMEKFDLADMADDLEKRGIYAQTTEAAE